MLFAGVDLISIERQRVQSIFNEFHNRSVLVIGDIMLDEYLIGTVHRISPEAPVPVVDVTDREIRFGGAANVAMNISTLGLNPVIIGVIGNDHEGEICRHLLKQHGMKDSGLVELAGRATTLKTRIIGQTQHIVRVDKENKNYLSTEDAEKLIHLIESLIDTVDGVIIQDYNKGVLTESVIRFSIDSARRKNKLITVDPKFLNFKSYSEVSLFKPNIKETEAALAIHIDCEEDLLQAGKQLMDLLKPQSLLITRGSKGMSLFEQNGSVKHIPTKARKIADVSGAGDTVISSITASLLGGATFQEAATIANYAAGLVCEEIGIVPVNKDKLFQACIGNYF
jgi:rfaE bifunctional protein kinase chain/domain